LLETTASAGQKEVVVDVLDVFRREGREEGRREGRAEGRAHTLLEQLAARFGPVPAEVKERILAAKEATLTRWSLRVLTAPTLEAVLDSKAKKAASVRRPAIRRHARAS
jgi:predicted transposase YdaD